jgi:hypothetical protein
MASTQSLARDGAGRARLLPRRAAQRLHDPHASQSVLRHSQVPLLRAVQEMPENPQERVSTRHVPKIWHQSAQVLVGRLTRGRTPEAYGKGWPWTP